jgi:hypothetical protein
MKYTNINFEKKGKLEWKDCSKKKEWKYGWKELDKVIH